MKDSLLTTPMYWSALYYVVEIHLSELHREMYRKTYCGVLQFPAASVDSG